MCCAFTFSPEQDQRFWDETIWAMRDKSRDSFMPDDEYYGVKGLKRVPNSIVLSGCALLVVVLSIGHFFLGYKYVNNESWCVIQITICDLIYRVSEKSIGKLDVKSKKSHELWVEAKTKAK